MAERAHGLAVLRGLPTLAARGARTIFQLALTAAGLVWLDPASWPLVLAAALAATLVPLAFQSSLHERELSLRNHHGALSRFYLETLLGLVAVRVHGAERRLRREHEGMLVEWLRAGRKLARAGTAARACTTVVGLGSSVLLVLHHVARHPSDPGTLLFAYWALSLASIGDQIAQVAEALPAMRNATLRALEPISARLEPEPAPEEVPEAQEEPSLAPAPLLRAAGAVPSPLAPAPGVPRAPRPKAGVALSLRGVDVRIGGHPVLSGIDLDVEPGEHVAIVGASGAGKSTLVALFLGFHRASAGTILADGERLGTRASADLRRATAWIDPSVQLFNQSLFENLIYGTGSAGTGALASSIEEADLRDVLEALPDALETPLGEGGGFLSAGEGQRVRLGRALLRPGVRLALLDEPFRGLDRDTRRELLARARRRFAGATVLCATHDLAETLAFDRVVVLDGGRIVADGAPRALLADARGAYAELVRAERELAEIFATSRAWTRWRVGGGRVEVEP
jgi:ATP-binding cassette subfamily B protein